MVLEFFEKLFPVLVFGQLFLDPLLPAGLLVLRALGLLPVLVIVLVLEARRCGRRGVAED